MSMVVVMCLVAGVGVAVALWNWRLEHWIERLRGEREVMSLGSRGSSSGGIIGDGNGKGVNGKVMEMPAFVEKGDLERGGRR